MEVVINNSCILCEEITAILTQHCVAPYMKYLYSTFFDKCKDALQEFMSITVDGSMCVLCSHQVVIAHKFKDSYEDVFKKSNNYKKNKLGCFLCEQKGVDLIDTDKNPNQFGKKILSFMATTIYPTPSDQVMVCFDCIFYLNIWFRIFSYVQKKCKTKLCETTINGDETPTIRTKTQKKVHFNDDCTVIEVDDSITTQRSPRVKSPPPSPKQKPGLRIANNKGKPGPLSTKRKKVLGPASVKKMKSAGPLSSKKSAGFRNKKSVQNIVKKQFKHLKSVKQLFPRRKWTSDIANDYKLHLKIPYVLVYNKSRTTRDDSKSPDLIEIFDSDEDTDAMQKEPVKKKIGFKIKMSTNFLTGPKSKSAKKNKMDLPTEYTCEICDRILDSLSEYKVHVLWHDKPERPIVNVTRSDIFTAAKSDTEQKENNDKGDESSEVIQLDDINDHDIETSKTIDSSDLNILDDQKNENDKVNNQIDENSQVQEKIIPDEENNESEDVNVVNETTSINKESEDVSVVNHSTSINKESEDINLVDDSNNIPEKEPSIEKTSDQNNLTHDIESHTDEKHVDDEHDVEASSQTKTTDTSINETKAGETLNEFSSDSENNETRDYAELGNCSDNEADDKISKEVDHSVENEVDNNEDHSIENKKRNHDDHVNIEGNCVLQNGNDSPPSTKRAKTIDSPDILMDDLTLELT